MKKIENTKSDHLDPLIVQISKFARDKYILGNISDKVFLAERITADLNNNPDIQNIMIRVGYLPEKIARFSSVYNIAVENIIIQQKKQSDRDRSYDVFKKLYDASKKDFSYLIKIAKIALADEPKKCDSLQLAQKRGRSIADNFTYMDLFYSIILNDSQIIELVSAYGYHFERINKFYADYLKTRETYKNYRLEFSEAVESTRIRDLKIKELDSWVYEYFKLIKIAEGTMQC
jgi:hypothetical protein